MRKLVRRNKDGRLTEIDRKALRREGEALMNYIMVADPAEEIRYSYQKN